MANDGAQTHFILLLKPKNAAAREPVFNCFTCVFIGNKCLCFVWVKVKGSYSVGIDNTECFETMARRYNITGRMRSNQHLKECFCSALEL